jgi:hypothetical protein
MDRSNTWLRSYTLASRGGRSYSLTLIAGRGILRRSVVGIIVYILY